MVKLKVTGMTCNHCAAAVNKALSGVQGAKDVRVNLKQGEATIEGSAKPDDLIKAVVEEGYGAEMDAR
jgi:copper chaperone CopZ